MRPWPRLASVCCRCRRPGEESRTGGSPSLPSWVGSALLRGPICPRGPAKCAVQAPEGGTPEVRGLMRPWPRLAPACCRYRRRGEKSRTGGSPSLPSWVGSALPRGPICPAARFGVLPMPTTRGESTDGQQPVPTLVGRVRAAARPHLSTRPGMVCGRCRRRGEKSRTGGSPSLPSWVGSALPRGPICPRGPAWCAADAVDAGRSHVNNDDYFSR